MFGLFNSGSLKDLEVTEAKLRTKQRDLDSLEREYRALQTKYDLAEARRWQLENENVHLQSKIRVLESNLNFIKGGLERTVEYLVSLEDFDKEFIGLQITQTKNVEDN